MTRRSLFFVTLALATLAVGVAVADTQITAAGASFPYPMYSKWFDEYHKMHSAVQINYQSVGSGAGIAQVTAGTVEFGASDGPMTDEQIKKFMDERKTGILHFPTVMGAVVPVYNIPGVTAKLNFTGAALAGIYMGKITKWNDPAIASVNKGVKLPDAKIEVVHRSDGSGTTYIWTDYLSKKSPEWAKDITKGTSVKWPVGSGGKGNEGVSGTVQQTTNSIGYVELIYALQNKMSYGMVDGIEASLASVSLAASKAAMPDDFRVSITASTTKGAYPVSSFTWLLIPEKLEDAGKKQAIKDFLKWMLTDGQKMTEALSYAPLPASVVKKEMAAIDKIK